MNDIYDTITGERIRWSCPDCGGYDGADYKIVDPEDVGELDPDILECSICGGVFR